MNARRVGLATTLLTVTAVCAASAPALGATAPQRAGPDQPTTSGASGAGVTPTTCSDAATQPGWQCGSISVPLDRAHPAAGSIPIGFAVFPHTDQSAPAAEPVFVTDGGPGDATTAS